MKVLQIIARLNVGGPTRQVVWLTRLMRNENFQTLLLAGEVPDGEEDMSYFAREHQVEPFYIPEMSRELSPKDLIALWKVYRYFVATAPDVIHTHTAKAGFLGRAAGFMYRWLNWKKIFIVHTFHGHVFHSYYGSLKTKVFLVIEKLLARFATDKIIVITQQQFDEIHGEFGIGEKEQYEIVPLGIDLQPFHFAEDSRAEFRHSVGATDDEILIGFIGRLTEIKNVSLLLKVAAIYQSRKNHDSPNLRFLIVGDGNLRSALESEAQALNLNDTVQFIGNQPNVETVYAGLDLVALCSLNEGTPLSLIEAMASGIPIISTNVGGVCDLVGEIDCALNGFDVCERGIKIDDASAENFYNGLIYLAKSETLQKTLTLSGRKFVWSTYGKERLVSDMENLFNRFAKQ